MELHRSSGACGASPVSLLMPSGAGVGEVEVVIMDPAGKKNTVTCNIEDKGNSSYRCTYKPTQEGQHTIFVTFAGGQISKSPFTVNVGEGTTDSNTKSDMSPPKLLWQQCFSFWCLTVCFFPPAALLDVASSGFFSCRLLSDRGLLASVRSVEQPLPSAVISCFLGSLLGTHSVHFCKTACMSACVQKS